MDEIEIVDYDPRWPRLFEEERATLTRLLPAGQILAIEHAGSTAVAGLAAKPIIDIYLAVASIEHARPLLIEPIRAAGYAYWDENPDATRMFFVKGMPPYGERRSHHIHVMEHDSEAWLRTLIFRDYLQQHADEAHRYGGLKRALAARFRSDREAYTRAKDAHIDAAVAKARAAAPASRR